MISLPPKKPAVWIIMFMPREQSDFWTLFTSHRKNFDHCVALRYDAIAGCWFVVDWSSHGLYCEPAKRSDVNKIFAHCIEQNWPCLKFTSKVYYGMPVFGFYCVSAVKHLLGFKSWAVTPYQLYCALKKSGAKEIFVEDMSNKGE